MLEIGALSCVEESAVRFSFEMSATERWRKGAIYISSINPPGLVLGLQPGGGDSSARCAVSLCHGERLRVDTGDSLIVKSMKLNNRS